VTRERMYLSTMEKVYSNTSKVMVDVDGGNNMMYLPLDKIMQQQSPAPRLLPDTRSTMNKQAVSSKPTTSNTGRNDRFNQGRN